MSIAENPRAVVGSNEAPAAAQRVSAEMAREYGQMIETVDSELERARKTIPATIESDEDLKLVTTAVVEMRRIHERLEAFRTKEKEPYWEGGKAVDSFFNGLKDRLSKEMDVIGARGHAWNQKKIDAERAERQRLADEAAREAARLRKIADDKAAAELEAQRARDRARKPERVEELKETAAQLGAGATAAKVAASVAASVADAAIEATQVKTAELARQRFDTGHMATGKQVPHVEITDVAKLPLETLRPYFKEEHLLAAVKAYGKVTNHKKPLPGALIEMRDATVYR
jgi:hypothetical protein